VTKQEAFICSQLGIRPTEYMRAQARKTLSLNARGVGLMKDAARALDADGGIPADADARKIAQMALDLVEQFIASPGDAQALNLLARAGALLERALDQADAPGASHAAP